MPFPNSKYGNQPLREGPLLLYIQYVTATLLEGSHSCAIWSHSVKSCCYIGRVKRKSVFEHAQNVRIYIILLMCKSLNKIFVLRPSFNPSTCILMKYRENVYGHHMPLNISCSAVQELFEFCACIRRLCHVQSFMTMNFKGNLASIYLFILLSISKS